MDLGHASAQSFRPPPVAMKLAMKLAMKRTIVIGASS
jgi:hypothetical protein